MRAVVCATLNYTMHLAADLPPHIHSKRSRLRANFGARPKVRPVPNDYPLKSWSREQLCGGARVNSIIALYSAARSNCHLSANANPSSVLRRRGGGRKGSSEPKFTFAAQLTRTTIPRLTILRLVLPRSPAPCTVINGSIIKLLRTRKKGIIHVLHYSDSPCKVLVATFLRFTKFPRSTYKS